MYSMYCGVDTVDTLVVSTAGKSILIMGLLQRKSVTDDEKETSVGFVGYLVEALIKQRIMCIPFQLFSLSICHWNYVNF